jgi:hypothetical protein
MHRAPQVLANHLALREMRTHVGAVSIDCGHPTAGATKQNQLVIMQVPRHDLAHPDLVASTGEIPRSRGGGQYVGNFHD